MRRDIGFLDLGDQRRNRRLVELLSVIRRVLFATDLDPVFHVPTGHQRAVGELMIESDHATPGQGRCIGFATFCKRLDHDSYSASWFERIEAGIVEYAHHPEQGGNRLAVVETPAQNQSLCTPSVGIIELTSRCPYINRSARIAESGDAVVSHCA